MAWLYLMIILHVAFGLSCAYLAYESHVKAEPWFLSGVLFGALGLILVTCCRRPRRRWS